MTRPAQFPHKGERDSQLTPPLSSPLNKPNSLTSWESPAPVRKNRVWLPNSSSENLKQSAKEQRRNQTPHEKLIWDLVRHKRMGPKFRRQVAKLGYILDFWCPELGLVIESDGVIHDRKEDRQRDYHLAKFGVSTLRIPTSVNDPQELRQLIAKMIFGLLCRPLGKGFHPMSPQDRPLSPESYQDRRRILQAQAEALQGKKPVSATSTEDSTGQERA